ncbi:Kv channel-interacting protein 1-like isoform X2 [Artemia franciscana]|uniref:Kv channel-interacting protein 1-like isoform X2 n=1 Tax=Artemia franciscana TaxID=6661 RepID=UPI0032DA2FEC
MYMRILSSDIWMNTRGLEVEELDSPVTRCRPADCIEHICESTNFSRKEIQLMYRTFKQDCPSGAVYEETFRLIYSQFFPHGDASRYASYVFKAFDEQNCGCLSFDEFIKSLSLLTRGTAGDKLRWAFKLYDINKDGVITKEELQEIVASVHKLLGRSYSPGSNGIATEKLMEMHTSKIFQKLDSNGDGVVTLEEFLDACLQDETISLSLDLLESSF